jgi:prefoldin subunit 5
MPDPNGQNGEARIDRIERAIEALTGKVNALTGDVQALTNDIQALTGSHRTVVGDIAALAESQFRLIDGHKEEYKGHLRAQVILNDMVEKQVERAKLSDQRMDRLESGMQVFEKGMQELREAQKHTEQMIHALITVMDDMIRRNPPQN